MAAKPPLSPVPWATAGNYPPSVYPAQYPWLTPHAQAGLPTQWSNKPRKNAVGLAGFAANGFTPLAPDAADLVNEQQARIADTCIWVQAGSEFPGEDTHIVETGGDGEVKIAALEVGPGTLVKDTIVATSFDGRGGLFTGSGTWAGVEGTTSGTGAGGFFHVANGAPALVANGTANDSQGISAMGHGTGEAIKGTGDNAPGLEAFTGAAAAPAIRGTGANAAASQGVVGLAGHPDAAGVRGLGAAFGTVLGAGVRAEGQGDATGLVGVAVDGYAASLSNGGERAQLRLSPNTGLPPTAAQGDVGYDTVDPARDGALIVRQRLGWQYGHASVKGYASARGSLAGAGTTVVGPIVADTAVLDPSFAGDVIVTGTAGLDYGADTNTATIDLWDATLGALVASLPLRAPYINSGAVSGRNTTVVIRAIYTLPDAATRTFQFRVTSTGGSVTWVQAGVTVEGVY